MTDTAMYKSTFARHLTAAFTMRISLSSLLEEVYQGHIGSPNETKRIIRQTTWINDELHYIQEYLESFSSQNSEIFCVILLEKSVEKMILDCKNLSNLANEMALSRIHQRDSTKTYKRIRLLMDSVLQHSTQVYDQLKLLETTQTSEARMN